MLSLLILLTLLTGVLPAQENTLLRDKPGTFKLQKEALNGQGPDLYGKMCACTKAESDAMLGILEGLVQQFRKAPVLADIKGFDGVCRLYGGRCSSKFGYAVPADIKFWFKSWSLYKGQEAQWVNEPPQWIIEVNQPDKFRDNGFNVSDYSNTSDPTNPAFSEKAQSETSRALNELFYVPGVKEVIKPGIDRYGEFVVIYNPGQPPYWEQVTVREAFRLLLDYYKCMPDRAAVDALVPILNMEFEGFSEEEKDSYAYFGSSESISRVGSKKNDTPVVRPNPDYWNRTLPKASIQLIVLEMPQPEIVAGKMERSLKNEDGYYYVYKLMNELNLGDLTNSIDRQNK
ncbi:hypothetical protein EG832_06815 [bacterium]|nr:hypothetical protein [bacterium]